MVKVTMILFFIVCGLISSNAQVLLSNTDDGAEKIQSHLDKLDYLQIIKASIELKQGRTRQDTLSTDDRNPLSRPTDKNSKPKIKELAKKKGEKTKTPE